jgi:hypothetical protein
MNMDSIQFLLTFILSALSLAHAEARADERGVRLAGTWHSQASTTASVTTLYRQGRFRTAFMDGDSEIGSVTGNWRLEGDSFVWIYDGSELEDRNPILTLSDDAFSLREANGDVSSFYRQNVADPDSQSLLPV